MENDVAPRSLLLVALCSARMNEEFIMKNCLSVGTTILPSKIVKKRTTSGGDGGHHADNFERKRRPVYYGVKTSNNE